MVSNLHSLHQLKTSHYTMKPTNTDRLTREQAVEIVGEANVSKIEYVNCEPTNCVGYNGACQGDNATEWSASIRCLDKDGEAAVLTAYYYTSNEDDDRMAAADGDGSVIDWEISHYSIR